MQPRMMALPRKRTIRVGLRIENSREGTVRLWINADASANEGLSEASECYCLRRAAGWRARCFERARLNTARVFTPSRFNSDVK